MQKTAQSSKAGIDSNSRKPFMQADVVGEATNLPTQAVKPDARSGATKPASVEVGKARPSAASGKPDNMTVADVPPAEDENQPSFIGERNLPKP